MPDEAYMGDDDWNGLKRRIGDDPDDEDGLAANDDDEPWPVSEYDDDDEADDDDDDDDDDLDEDDDDDWESGGMWGEEDWDDAQGHVVDDRERPAPRYPDQVEDELSRTRGADWGAADPDEEDWDDDSWPRPGDGLSGAHVVSGYEDSRRPPTKEVVYREDRKGWVDGASSGDRVWDPGADRDRRGAGKPESAEPFRVKRPRKVIKVKRPRK